MKIVNCTAFDFSSYEFLAVGMSDRGATLVYGPTGSGKSTLLDLPFWTLYGETAKGGSVDEVRSWVDNSLPTTGRVWVETSSGAITVTRTRGRSNQNDLYWVEGDSDKKIRGKDLKDTQILLELRLGVSRDLYMLGSYCHEFSPAGAFFTSSVKARRGVFEQLTNLFFPVDLASRASGKRKEIKLELHDINLENVGLRGQVLSLENSIKNSTAHSKAWFFEKEQRIHELKSEMLTFQQNKLREVQKADALHLKFEEERVLVVASIDKDETKIRAKIEELSKTAKVSRCVACGVTTPIGADSTRDLTNLQLQLGALSNSRIRKLEQRNPYEKIVEVAQNKENNYAAMIEAEERRTNPFTESLKESEFALRNKQEELIAKEETLKRLHSKVSKLDHVTVLCQEMKGELLKQSVSTIQESTNRYLEKYFYSEIRVQFELEGSDSLSVSIQKSGYACTYKQLSKGQRGLLKLCFSISVMETASNSAGIHFDNLFFDEALDGLDSNLKLKAYGLIQELSTRHSSVFVVEHDTAFQEMFTNKLKVTMESDVSTIEIENE